MRAAPSARQFSKKNKEAKNMAKHNAYPTKTTLNLMIRERRVGDLRIILPCALVGLLLVGLFCHFAVVERLTKAYAAEQSAERAESALAQAQAELKEYDEVEAEYNRYFSDALFSGDTLRSAWMCWR